MPPAAAQAQPYGGTEVVGPPAAAYAAPAAQPLVYDAPAPQQQQEYDPSPVANGAPAPSNPGARTMTESP